jgi:putative endonuclease
MNRTEDTPPPPTRPSGTGPASRSRTLGAFGEAYAARHLVDRGMVLLDRNWRCELGEIDLVLRDGDTLVFCEVKTRSSALYGTPLESVTARKAARLRRLAARWLADHQVRPRDVRLDLVGVLVPRTGSPSVEHAAGVG